MREKRRHYKNEAAKVLSFTLEDPSSIKAVLCNRKCNAIFQPREESSVLKWMFVLNTPLLYVQCNSSLVVPGERKKTYPHISQYVNVWEEATFILLRCSRSGAHTPPILVCIFFWFVKKVKTRNKISRSLKVLTNEGEKVTFHMCIDIFYTSLILSLKFKKTLLNQKSLHDMIFVVVCWDILYKKNGNLLPQRNLAIIYSAN